MKKFHKFFMMFLIGVSCYASCPDLSLEGTPLPKEPPIKTSIEIYKDIVKAYNKTDNIERYLTREGLFAISSTNIWGTLMVLKYFAQQDEATSEQYNSLLRGIDSTNPDWCHSKAYEKNLGKIRVGAGD